jgi:large subunit ribosomal protein L29
VKAAEIRQLSDAELLNELENSRQRLFNLNFQRTTQNLDSTAELGKIRRDIARMQTIWNQRQRERAAEPVATERAAKEGETE